MYDLISILGKKRIRASHVYLAVLALLMLLAACSRERSNPKVYFVAPGEGETVTAPVMIKTGADDFTVEPAGEIKEHHGHLHIMIDASCVPAGQVIPKDDQHVHYGQGQTEVELALSPGSHRLCLQAADGAHVALDGGGMSDEITITVE